MEATINRERTIGIEIEVVLPIVGAPGTQNLDVQQLVADVLTHEGLPSVARGYSHAAVPAGQLFCVEHDSSLRDDTRYGGVIHWAKLEIKNAPMAWDELSRVLPPALEVVRFLGSRCNVSTGLHVHHHVPEIVDRPEIARNLWHLWWRFHPVMYGLVAPSRKNNQYCRMPRPQDAKRYDGVASYSGLCREVNRADRYEGLNLKNLADESRRTVEWRLHAGTTDWRKISAWILATQRLTEHAIARSCHYRPDPVPNSQAGLNALMVTTGLKGNSRIYRKVEKDLREVGRFLLRRWKEFNLPADPKSETVAA